MIIFLYDEDREITNSGEIWYRLQIQICIQPKHSAMSIRVAIFEDNVSLNRALSHMVDSADNLTLAGSFYNCSNVLHDIAVSNPDVVLMDIQMPEVNGVEGVKIIRKQFPKMKILMQTVFDNDQWIFDAIVAGASGYILKGMKPEDIVSAISEAYTGGAPMSPPVANRVFNLFQNHARLPESDATGIDYHLSRREKDVLRCMTEGKPYKIVSDELNISYNTVRSHVQSIYEKLHVQGMTEAVAKAIQEKLF